MPFAAHAAAQAMSESDAQQQQAAVGVGHQQQEEEEEASNGNNNNNALTSDEATSNNNNSNNNNNNKEEQEEEEEEEDGAEEEEEEQDGDTTPVVCRICQRGDEDGRPLLRFLPVEHDIAAATASPSVMSLYPRHCSPHFLRQDGFYFTGRQSARTRDSHQGGAQKQARHWPRSQCGTGTDALCHFGSGRRQGKTLLFGARV